MSMLGIGIVLLIQRLTGSYAIAGAVAATFNVSFAVAGPPVRAPGGPVRPGQGNHPARRRTAPR